ncbi:MAG: THUMP domain-containing protein [Candidatus Aenigmatarchaeota archaeon]
MRKPECLLLRVGEASLKSEQVQRKWDRILAENIRVALNGIDYELNANPSRFFVHTKRLVAAQSRLSKVFGLTSVSPCWVCRSDLDEIGRLAAEVALIKIKKGESFAIRARRAGRHHFSSRAIAEAAGASVARATGAKVDLTKPDREIFIECRSTKTYVFTDKTELAGGLPLGTAGRMLAVVGGRRDAVAAWLMMRRGAELVVVGNASKLKPWHIGREMKSYKKTGDIAEIAEKEGVFAVVSGKELPKSTEERLKKGKMLVLYPLIGWESKMINPFERVILH